MITFAPFRVALANAVAPPLAGRRTRRPIFAFPFAPQGVAAARGLVLAVASPATLVPTPLPCQFE